MGAIVIAEEIAVWAIVAAAVAYLVWKFGLASRAPRRKRVDVPTKNLVRKRPKGDGGCH
jgi:hypothetical protein